MPLLRFDDIGLEFGDQLILRDAEFSIDKGERICLIGRNGAGKSTTLKLITGELEPDRGEIVRQSGLIVSELQQTLPDAMAMPVSAPSAIGVPRTRASPNSATSGGGASVERWTVLGSRRISSAKTPARSA